VVAWLARSRPGRAYLGIQLREVEIPPARAAGLLVAGLRRNGPAERAGLLPGDVLLAMDGAPLRGGEALGGLLAARRGGEIAVFDVLRPGGVQRLEVVLAVAED